MRKTHAVNGGIREVFGRRWLTVWRVCGGYVQIDPPSARLIPHGLTAQRQHVTCARCKRILRSRRKPKERR